MAGQAFVIRDHSYDGEAPHYSGDHEFEQLFEPVSGRRRVFFSYGPKGYVTETRRVIERVYKEEDEPLKDYLKYGRPSSPKKFDDFISRIQAEVNRPSSPKKVDGFISRIHEEANRPTTGRVPFRGGHWTPNSAGHHHDGYGARNDHSPPPKPLIVKESGWARPSHESWSNPPPMIIHQQLSEPTNDIGTAMRYLIESAQPPPAAAPVAPPRRRFGVPVSSPPTTDYGYGGSVKAFNSGEAERRNIFRNRDTFVARETEGRLIDSREASKKYGGSMVL